jgi:hypothetical protein
LHPTSSAAASTSPTIARMAQCHAPVLRDGARPGVPAGARCHRHMAPVGTLRSAA